MEEITIYAHFGRNLGTLITTGFSLWLPNKLNVTANVVRTVKGVMGPHLITQYRVLSYLGSIQFLTAIPGRWTTPHRAALSVDKLASSRTSCCSIRIPGAEPYPFHADGLPACHRHVPRAIRFLVQSHVCVWKAIVCCPGRLKSFTYSSFCVREKCWRLGAPNTDLVFFKHRIHSTSSECLGMSSRSAPPPPPRSFVLSPPTRLRRPRQPRSAMEPSPSPNTNFLWQRRAAHQAQQPRELPGKCAERTFSLARNMCDLVCARGRPPPAAGTEPRPGRHGRSRGRCSTARLPDVPHWTEEGARWVRCGDGRARCGCRNWPRSSCLEAWQPRTEYDKGLEGLCEETRASLERRHADRVMVCDGV